MLTVEEIENILAKQEMKALKSLGQNFLINEKVLLKIVESADIKKSDNIIEIGPGLGTLTEELAKKCTKVIAIEKDRKMAELLKRKFKNVEIINDDILKININELIEKYQLGEKYKLVANIPYYITSPIIKLFLENSVQPEIMVLLAQKEVAKRICEKEGRHSILSLSVQIFGEPEIISFVSKNSFYPMPQVDSAILKIKNIKKNLKEEESAILFRVIKIGFSARRKKLSNNLMPLFKLEKKEIENKLEKIGIKSNARAQELSLEDWKKIAKMI